MVNRNKLITSLLLALFIMPSVFALGVSSPYWKANPLEMYPGETKEIQFALSNSINEESDAKAFVSLTKGAEIAGITSGSEYTVVPGANNQKIILEVSIPQTTPLGSTYDLELSVKSSPESKEGNVQLGIGYKVSFPVVIKEESAIPKETPFSDTPVQPRTGWKSFNIALVIIPLIIVIALGIILYFFLKKKN